MIKLWFSVSTAEQRTRFLIRRIDPVRQWKLSPTDLASLDRWDDYTAAKEAMFEHTDTAFAPWTVVKSNDKKRARINAMRYVLEPVRLPPPGRRRRGGARPARSSDRPPRYTSTARPPRQTGKGSTTGWRSLTARVPGSAAVGYPSHRSSVELPRKEQEGDA